ncbi:MAG TPA: class D sortase [Chloroflexota bacterium]|nr:class D sortase [Chloroflexota bacterium]
MARNGKQPIEELSVRELEHLLYRKKRTERRLRLRRLREMGRVVDVAHLPAPDQQGTAVLPALQANFPHTPPPPPSLGRRIANKGLLLVEITAVIGLLVILFNLWTTQRELNQELAVVQQAEAVGLALPTATPLPVIDLVVLPTGHRYIEGRSPEPVESGDIPAHLLPVLQAYQPPPIPTPGPEQARVIQIPAIGVNNAVVEGAYDWEQLKRGVAHHIGSAQPGQVGNMVMAAHNDVYGAIFQHLDQLSPGDEIVVQTNQRAYTYVVTKIDIVLPTDVHVLAPTDHASATLISCYPYRINTHRIVVFADLVTDTRG